MLPCAESSGPSVLYRGRSAWMAPRQLERTLSGFDEHVCEQREDLHGRRDCFELLLLRCCPGSCPYARVQVQPLSLHLLSMHHPPWENLRRFIPTSRPDSPDCLACNNPDATMQCNVTSTAASQTTLLDWQHL